MELKDTGERFVAVDVDGNEYHMMVFVEIHSYSSGGHKKREEGHRIIRTEDGRDVSPDEDGGFTVFDDIKGEIHVKRADGDAT